MNALRKYDIKDIVIGGDKLCKHEWKEHERKPSGGSGKNANVGGNQDDYSNLRDGSYFSKFCTYCNAWQGQYGLEPTPSDYVSHSLLWAKEAWRVLRNDGIMFLNLADSYAGSGGAGGDYNAGGLREGQPKYKQTKSNYPSKCQLLIPHRVTIALVDAGWCLRNTICWLKSNAMPESVTDRFSKKYEYIFMFTKQEKYYFDLDAVKIPTTGRSRTAGLKTNNYDYKNPGDVWQIPTQPSSEKHYAMWPERLIEHMIKCSTKAGDIVLDPFCGSATTLKVAEELNRKGVGIDLGYHTISNRMTSKIQKKMFV